MSDKSKKKIFIDGRAGTTGLRIYERLQDRDDIEFLTLGESERKEYEPRKKMLNEADIVFLCLPDAAAIEAVSMVENDETVIIDTSTAHRTESGWTYGFPELSDEIRNDIKTSKRIAVPGCHAGGFIALVRPLTECGIIDRSTKIAFHSLTGYSGGGKKMIAAYEEEGRSELLSAPRDYALTQNHKHLKEMKAITGLETAPIFSPIVADFYSGMSVSVPLFASSLKNGCGISDIEKVYEKKYNTKIVKFIKSADDGDGTLSAGSLSGKDNMVITVFGNEERIILNARYDNLGKGASGAAIEILNIILGEDDDKGLDID